MVLIKKDLDLIRGVVENSLERSFRDPENPLKKDILSFKSEILGEIQKLREDVTIVVGYRDKIENHNKRIKELEKIHPRGRHLSS
ncbi:hypothetical protein A2962_02880 [Candidatus Woesebacteria bacterium RIFCSPLOWO2_01_FULL_39_61]|uniref:Uncharacterized protein n=1 Tax=Candidatus Woesebacteria bacterium RIFCSPHIGHO2_02_FULL_39_13 TaxID=1802505 RepID=A0A1F7YZ11_9BACT|nr:MAG: hypothetical protein A2692_00065 [Candidatus Woesebacteria bacterium RIFCSPHIGHO2_01_FULL_39_95]OGM32424.1 MAG: hypothetical protein A3D01_04595 [Candidatus Woesebacteria bacterium RIFCSPHIGHO2_02_FULL_39_13]OGM38132.1 MAG: hypothetical protein A3E13_02625 [Candidatus Woesebacteria bacterium RIFCSPHIGHO2_12_FULL_40_20]OGM67383.1 MAG: hypothetical protein A2962_02880 [Candidatus Woesebacteria bacterium RIFCSPLOWO2_01_FULL_39_61]OGM75247.1 MAG: hypothetical protein A3H19_01240 [Candidatus